MPAALGCDKSSQPPASASGSAVASSAKAATAAKPAAAPATPAPSKRSTDGAGSAAAGSATATTGSATATAGSAATPAANLVCCASGKGMDLIDAADCHEALGDIIMLTSQCLDDEIGNSPTETELAAAGTGGRVCCDAGDELPGFTTGASCAREGGKPIADATCEDIAWGILPKGELVGERLTAYQKELRASATRWFDAVASKRAPGDTAEPNVTLLMSSDSAACAAWRGDREYDQTERPNTQAFDGDGVACLPHVKVPGLANGRWQDGWRCPRYGLASDAGQRAFDRVRAQAVEAAGNSGGAMRCFESTDAEDRPVSVFFAFSGDASKIQIGVFDRATK